MLAQQNAALATEAQGQPAQGRYRISRSRAERWETTEDWIAEEVPVALVYNGLSHAVMLATPRDLEEFALGFSLSEGVIASPREVYDIEVFEHPTSEELEGIEVHLTIAQSRMHALKQRRRALAGRTGCGLCGQESLLQLKQRPPAPRARASAATPIPRPALERALAHLKAQQTLFNQTGSVHAAAWCSPEGEILCLREDVGRHNALDKLVGARLGRGQDLSSGLLVMTSRASYEIVQKAAACGVAVVAAVSGPTGMAVRLAEAAGLTLVGFARRNHFCVYAHPQRIV